MSVGYFPYFSSRSPIEARLPGLSCMVDTCGVNKFISLFMPYDMLGKVIVWSLKNIVSILEDRDESGFRPPLCTYRLNWAR